MNSDRRDMVQFLRMLVAWRGDACRFWCLWWQLFSTLGESPKKRLFPAISIIYCSVPRQRRRREDTTQHPPLPTTAHPITTFSTSILVLQFSFTEKTNQTEPEMKPFTSSLADPSSSNVTGQQLSSASCAASSHDANQKHFDKKENERHGDVNPNNDFKTADFKTADFKTFCSQWMML
jgi:hypothetical protein